MGHSAKNITPFLLIATFLLSLVVSCGDGSKPAGEAVAEPSVNPPASSYLSQVSTPTISPPTGTYSTDQNVTITTPTPHATIHYTTDGATPTVASNEYAEAIAVAGDGTTVTIRAIAVANGMQDSNISEATISIDYSRVSTPIFSLPGGTYAGDQRVTISTLPAEATIFYTTDGSDPTVSSTEYTEAIEITGDGTTVTIRAFAVLDGMKDSTIAEATYSIEYNTTTAENPPEIQAEAPVFDRPGGYFVDPISVRISTETNNAAIRYTTDLSNPSCSGGESHSSPIYILIENTTTINAIACREDFADSDISQTTFTKVTADIRVDPDSSATPIGDAITAAGEEDVIYIPAGTYPEDDGGVTINKRITLIGAGSGNDPNSNTILRYADAGENVINISRGGLSDAERLVLRNMQVTGAQGTLTNGTGIRVITADGHIEFDNITVTANGGYGILFDTSSATQDIVIKNSNFTYNGSHGIRVPSVLPNVTDLVIDNCIFKGNIGAGIQLYRLGSDTNVTISNSVFENNASEVEASADILLFYFNGDATLSNISIISSGSDSAITISGEWVGVNPNREGIAAGMMSLSDITIGGRQQASGGYPSAALMITRYSDLTNVSFNNVILNSAAPNGLFLGTLTGGAALNLGNMEFSGNFADYYIKLGYHGNTWGYRPTTVEVDATDATFEDAMSDAYIEDRIYHSVDNAELGTVIWATP